MITRRLFTAILGAAPAAAPMAVANPVPSGSWVSKAPEAPSTHIPVRELLSRFGIPEIRKHQLRENAKQLIVADGIYTSPNIAALRSISAAHRQLMELERRYQKSLAEETNEEPWEQFNNWCERMRKIAP